MKPVNFPEIDVVKKSIEKLKQIKLPKYSAGMVVEEYVKNINDTLLNEFGFMLNAKQPMKGNKSYFDFYRARPVDDFININLIREHSYPPVNMVKMGRCNFPNNPVFYCSNNAGTALMEVVRNLKGDSKDYCISKWELISSEEDIFFESFLQVSLPPENYFNKLNVSFPEKIKSTFKKYIDPNSSEEQKEGVIEYLKYLDSCFINDQDYSISATLAHKTLFANHNCRTDILIYPSAQTKFKGINFALNPNFVENKLKMTRLYVLSFEEYESTEGRINFQIKRYADLEKNVIMWKSIHPENQEYLELIKEDFGEMNKPEFRKI